MANARVTAHPIKEGFVDTQTVLASGLTGADGRYALPTFTSTTGQPVVVVIQVRSDTVHMDELTQVPVPLPTTFVMRSVVVPMAADVSLPVSITPYTEMVVRAAETATDKLNAVSVAQGKSALSQMLGFDPIATDVNGIKAANDAEVNAHGLMLAAVSQMAVGADSATLGCALATKGESIACTVAKLAQAAKLDTVRLEIGTTDIGASLSEAVMAVWTNTSVVPADVDVSATVATVTDRLACVEGSQTNPCEVAQINAQTTGVAAAKAMFTALRTSIDGWFSRGGLSGAGRLNQDAARFETALSSAKAPLDQVTQDLAVMELGIRLYDDYLAGRTTVPSVGSWYGRAPGDDRTRLANGTERSNGAPWSVSAIGCTLRQADGSTATAPSNVHDIGCRSSMRIEVERVEPLPAVPGSIRITDWRHGLTLTPRAVNGAADRVFDYGSSASKRVRAQTCTVSVEPWFTSGCGALMDQTADRVNLQLDASGSTRGFSGVITVSPAGSSSLAMQVNGGLPALLDGANGTLVNDRQSVSLTVRDDGTASSVATLAGKVEAFDTASSAVASGTLDIASGSQFTFVAANEDGSRPASGTSTAFRALAGAQIGLSWRTADASLSGSLTATDGVWDLAGRSLVPTKLVFTGSLDRWTGSSSQNWITANVSMTQSGWANHDTTRPVSSTNPSYTVAGTFSGTVTPSDGKLPFFLSLSTSKASNEAYPKDISGTLRMGSESTPKVNIQLTATSDAAGAKTWRLHETVQDIALELRPNERMTQIRQGSGQVVVGNIDHDRRRVDYADLTFESLDLGL